MFESIRLLRYRVWPGGVIRQSYSSGRRVCVYFGPLSIDVRVDVGADGAPLRSVYLAYGWRYFALSTFTVCR